MMETELKCGLCGEETNRLTYGFASSSLNFGGKCEEAFYGWIDEDVRHTRAEDSYVGIFIWLARKKAKYPKLFGGFYKWRQRLIATYKEPPTKKYPKGYIWD